MQQDQDSCSGDKGDRRANDADDTRHGRIPTDIKDDSSGAESEIEPASLFDYEAVQ